MITAVYHTKDGSRELGKRSLFAEICPELQQPTGAMRLRVPFVEVACNSEINITTEYGTMCVHVIVKHANLIKTSREHKELCVHT
jgi:hypothetical protein